MLEENVPLDSSKQKQFVKSIKGIKRLLKKSKDAEPKIDKKEETKAENFKKKFKERGLVYLSHIPHGFYEHQMTQYFKQFGVVTNVRVIRSKHTGNSKGHAFVEFKEPTVAKIVAETMNNYLMGKRLIKAACIPPEEQRRNAFRKRWNPKNNPGHNHRLKMKKAYNAPKDEKGELKRATKLLSNFASTKEKLNALGINYDFFKPVDIPQSLLGTVLKEEKKEIGDDVTIIKREKPTEEKQNDQKAKITKNIKNKMKKQTEKENKDVIKKSKSESNVKDKEKKTNKSVVEHKNKTNNKKKYLKTGIQPLEDFIKIEHDKQSSDSAYEFDSDEYEKVLQNDDDDSHLSSSDESDEGSSADELNTNRQDSQLVATRGLIQKATQIMKGGTNVQLNLKQKNKRNTKEKVAVPPKKLKLEKAKTPQKAKAPQKAKKLITKKK